MDGANPTGADDAQLLISLEDGIATLTLNRPKALNALSSGLMSELQAAFDRIAQDAKVRVVVLRGAGRAFCAGHDLAEMEGLRAAPDGGRQAYQAMFAQCSRLMTNIPRLPQPVIAEVHGIATAAGCQLVASCDLAVAADDTRFGVNGVNIGLFCSTPMVALSRNIPRKQAFEMLTTGRFVDAAEAVELGLINRAVPANDLSNEVATLAQTLADKLGSAVTRGKRAFYEQLEMPLDAAYAHTGRVIAENMLDAQTEAGIAAFLNKE
ncbi:MAG: enoyl-CoA hydratase, partial [Pseudomonadota bacterium]